MSGSGSKFENKVREIARILWNVNEGEGAAQIIDGRERDCIFNSGDLINYIECTISNKKEKIVINTQEINDVNVLGAGDMYISYFIVNMLKNIQIKKSLQMSHDDTYKRLLERKNEKI